VSLKQWCFPASYQRYGKPRIGERYGGSATDAGSSACHCCELFRCRHRFVPFVVESIMKENCTGTQAGAILIRSINIK
jgi:hypothetical protein